MRPALPLSALLALGVALAPGLSLAEPCTSCPEREALRSIDGPFNEVVPRIVRAARCVPMLQPELARATVPVRWRHDGLLGGAPLLESLERLLTTMGVRLARGHAYSRTAPHCRVSLYVQDRRLFRAAVARGFVEGPD